MRALSLVLMENKCVETDDITHSGINCFYFYVQSVSTNLAQWLASRSTAGGAHTQHSSEDVRWGGGATTLATLIWQISAQEVEEPRASDIIELERWRVRGRRRCSRRQKLLKQRHQLAEQGNVHRKKLFTKVQGSVTSHYQMLR